LVSKSLIGKMATSRGIGIGGGLLTSNLSQTTLRKLAWYLQLPPNVDLDAYFEALPVNEEKAIVNFSKYTRALAGEDPEATPDDTIEEKRFRSSYNPPGANSNGVMGASAVMTISTSNGMSSTVPLPERINKRETATTTTTTATTTSTNGAGSSSVTNGGGGGAKRRKTVSANGASSVAGTSSSPTPFPIVEEGRKVAAKVDDEWMMMTVIKYSKRNKVYTVEDADDQADKKEAHEVARDLVIPLASPEYSPPVFTVGSRVLAVFPGTTSFYPAVVAKASKRATSSSNKQQQQQQNGAKPLYDYSLQFDDDDADDDGETVVKKVKGEFVIEEVVV
jgi:hypothetical protein